MIITKKRFNEIRTELNDPNIDESRAEELLDEVNKSVSNLVELQHLAGDVIGEADSATQGLVERAYEELLSSDAYLAWVNWKPKNNSYSFKIDVTVEDVALTAGGVEWESPDMHDNMCAQVEAKLKQEAGPVFAAVRRAAEDLFRKYPGLNEELTVDELIEEAGYY